MPVDAPRANLDASNPTLVDVYADDNAVIGLAFLDIARVTQDPVLRAQALASADRAARYPLEAGLWDGQFGGGLWWTNQRDALGDGKPAQSTALLAHVMAEMYAETGIRRTDSTPSMHWTGSIGASGAPITRCTPIASCTARSPTGTAITQRYFGYDQAIAIQAFLALYRREPEHTVYLERALYSGRSIDHYFWQQELGGYTLEADCARSVRLLRRLGLRSDAGTVRRGP